MPKEKGDIEIGRRAHEEVLRIFQSQKEAAVRLGVERKRFNTWLHGGDPTVSVLARLHFAGADVLYILTGKRSDVDPREEEETMSGTKIKCPFRDNVSCYPSQKHCESCGWNPVVAKERLEKFYKEHGYKPRE